MEDEGALTALLARYMIKKKKKKWKRIGPRHELNSMLG